MRSLSKSILLKVNIVAFVVILSAVAGMSPGAASAAPDYATQVGYFSATVTESLNWQLNCLADDPSIQGPIGIASGVAYADSMFGHTTYNHRDSNKGRYVQAGSTHVVTFEERETGGLASSSTFTASGSGGAPAETGYVVFALWASTARCTGSINGYSRPITYLDGSHAFLVGPEAFGTGVLVQDGSDQASTARTYSTDLKGGPAWAALSMTIGVGSLVFDDQVTRLRVCRAPNGGPCADEVPAASKMTATILAGAGGSLRAR